MLEEPGMISALVELIDDEDPNVVKRTIRVFTNVYRHSLALLAEGKLDPSKYMACYEEIDLVSTKLIALLSTADNEGVLVHLVRYLEAALVSHIMSNLTDYPEVAKTTIPMLRKGANALLDFVRTPYVGGIPFCVAIRALITVACYQSDMRSLVTSLVDKLLAAPPPNLFDHNVRSFHKTLQRNLFRLLRRAELPDEKEKLIDLMVRVGVPRRRLQEWAPRNMKRSAPGGLSTDGLPAKRLRPTVDEIIRFSPPSKTSTSAASKLESSVPNSSSLNDKSSPASPPPATFDSQNLTNLPRKSSPPLVRSIYSRVTEDEKPKSPSFSSSSTSPESPPSLKIDLEEDIQEHTSKESAGPTTKAASVLDQILSTSKEKISSKPGMRLNPKLAALLNPKKKGKNPVLNLSVKNSGSINSEINEAKKQTSDVSSSVQNGGACGKFIDRCTKKEKSIYNALTVDRVVDLLLDGCLKLPEEKPSFIPNIYLESEERMREKLAVLLALSVPGDDIGSIKLPDALQKCLEQVKDPNTGNSEKNPLSANLDDTEKKDINSLDTSNLEEKSSDFTADVDMRYLSSSRDPRKKALETCLLNSKPNSLKQEEDSPVDYNMSSNSDPRLKKNSPPHVLESSGFTVVNSDPRLSKLTGVSSSITNGRYSPSDDLMKNTIPDLSSSSPNNDPRLLKTPISNAGIELSPNKDPRMVVSKSDPQASPNIDPRLIKSGFNSSQVSNVDPRLSRHSPVPFPNISQPPHQTFNPGPPLYLDSMGQKNKNPYLSNNPYSFSNDNYPVRSTNPYMAGSTRMHMNHERFRFSGPPPARFRGKVPLLEAPPCFNGINPYQPQPFQGNRFR